MTYRILFADDECDLASLLSQKFRKKIYSKEWEFVFVQNGMEALKILDSDRQIDILVTDINMPELDGLSLLSKVNEIYPNLKTVIMSAYGDMEKIRMAMNRGAFDFLNKPIDFQDLEITINRTLAHVQQLKENLRFKQEKEEELRQSERQAREQAQKLELTLHELQLTQTQLIHSEKMSSLGQLLAGIAHEINNPVNFIYANLPHTSEYAEDLLNLLSLYQQHYPTPVTEIQEEADAIDLEFLIADLPKMLSSMKVGAERIRQIVLSLRNFSRVDETDMKAADIHEGIDVTLMILHSRLKVKPDHPPIAIIKEYGDLPLVECYAGQLNQVFMNVLANSIDALEDYDSQRTSCGGATLKLQDIQANPSTIRISTELTNGGNVAIRIADNGPGMTQEVQQRLFDPFFTTKPVGKGTGLGLSISYQIIVEKHGGIIKCVSSPGQGAEFIIEIPVIQHAENPGLLQTA